jgi:tRNA G18 (ribose-2'-O)-methylase SpoU
MTTPRDRILKLYQHCRDLEKKFNQITLDEIESLRNFFVDLGNESGPHFDKLSNLCQHLKSDMTLQTFQNIIVPIERWLNRSVRDDEFLVRSEDTSTSRVTYPLTMVLDHLRSAFNVGSFFRLADSLGVEKIILSGYTPTPESVNVQKTSLGSEDSVSWEWVENLNDWLKKHAASHQIIAWETSDRAKMCDNFFEQKPTIFIFGNERFGLEKDRLQLCHEIREIKMLGLKNSMNVAQSGAIAAYEWRKQWLSSR